jgi:hypothetical protein
VSVTRYRFGGMTKNSHPYCPARVLLGGRCPKGCLERSENGECIQLQMIDHVSLEKLSTGEVCFISRVYYSIAPDDENYMRLKAYCDYHGLKISVEEKSWNGVSSVSHIYITK